MMGRVLVTETQTSAENTCILFDSDGKERRRKHAWQWVWFLGEWTDKLTCDCGATKTQSEETRLGDAIASAA